MKANLQEIYKITRNNNNNKKGESITHQSRLYSDIQNLNN